MPSLTPLSPDQIADFFGAIDDFIGTGNGVQTIFNTSYSPLIDTRVESDDLIGVGDGIATAYQLFFFPVDAGTLELHKTAINGTALVDPTHYTVNLATGLVTLTVAGVAFLGTEQLHAKYNATSTVELHSGTIAGSLLTPVTHYTLTPRVGQVNLTAAGVAFLATAQLHAKYQIATGLVNIQVAANGSLRSSIVTQGIQRSIIKAKDDSLKYIHETLETLAILHVEDEREWLQNPTAIIVATSGNYVQPGEVVDETAITDSATAPYRNDILFKPLYPFGSSPNSPDPASPKKPDGLFGGSGSNSGNEQQRISDELGQQATVIAAGGNFLGNPGPFPFRDGSYDRFDAAGPMIAAINDQQTALAAQIVALNDFLTDNPSPAAPITSGDITAANTALANATAQQAANTAYLATITGPGPYPGLLNAALATRAADQATRQAQITTRIGEVTTLLTTLYNDRFAYIAMRARLADGTLRKYITMGLAITSTQQQIVDNAAKIDQIEDLLAGQ